MSDLTIGLLGALLATNQPLAVSNVIQQQTGLAVAVAADPVAQDLRDVMLADDAAQDEVSGWLHAFEAQPPAAKTRAASEELNRRIRERFDLVRGRYNLFLKNHPNHARGCLAFGSFLNEIGDEEGARAQFENSRQLDPKNPAVWNNLANYYSEHSPVTQAFADYAEAIKLKPDEPVYYQNFATTVYLFRKEAREYFHLDEQQVFDKAAGLYRQAMQLAPDNFVLATDYAESYYGIRPLRTNDALAAWTNALAIARTDAERQGVQLHLARVKIAAGIFEQASNHLAAVTNTAYLDLKSRLLHSLADHQNPPANVAENIATNRPAAVTPAAVAVTNIVSASTNIPDLSSNLLAAPPALREPKFQ